MVGETINTEIDVFYTKSNFFRVVHADGCYGGATPRGAINLVFYNERKAIPLQTRMKVENGISQQEAIIESKDGFVRELEVDVVMDFNASVSFLVWFKSKMEEFRQGLGISDEDWKNMSGGQ